MSESVFVCHRFRKKMIMESAKLIIGAKSYYLLFSMIDVILFLVFVSASVSIVQYICWFLGCILVLWWSILCVLLVSLD